MRMRDKNGQICHQHENFRQHLGCHICHQHCSSRSFEFLKHTQAIDGPSGISKMRSHRSDDIKYLAVDEMNRRRYWRTGDTREDIWRRISRPKLSLFVLANNNKLGIYFNRPHGMHPINLIRFHSHGFFARW